MNIPKKLAPAASRFSDLCFCSRARVKRQARNARSVKKAGGAVSVAVAHHNRGYLAYRPLCNLLCSPLVREVVFFDDGSSSVEFAALKETVRSLGCEELIRVESRKENRGAQTTKLDAVEACRSEWVLVLDSDNTAFTSYLHALGAIERRDPQTIYCSPFAFPYFSFRPLAGHRLDFDDCARLTAEGLLRRVFVINDGNYLVHRETYLERIGPLRSLHSDVADVMVANYLWLSAGGALQVLERGAYHHRIDTSSFYLRTADASRSRVMTIFELFEKSMRWDEGGKTKINAQ